MNPLPVWLQWAQALAFPAIAGIGAWVAWQQMQIARVKLQHDLYDRRLRAFDAVRNLILEVFQEGGASHNALRAYSLAISDAVFIFDDGASRYLEEIRDRVFRLHILGRKLVTTPPGDDATAMEEESNAGFAWLDEQRKTLPEKFRRFLSLDRRSNRSLISGMNMSLQDTAHKAPNTDEAAAVEKVQDHLIKMQSGIFTGAMAYTNLIIIAGYLTKSQLTTWTTQAVAILLIVSIGVFVGFEIFKMVMTSISTLSFSRLVKPRITHQDLQKLLDDHTSRARRQAMWLAVVWVPVLAACILTGYGAGILLVWNFVSNLFGP